MSLPNAGPGQLALWSPDTRSSLVLGLGEGNAVMSGGVGGWMSLERQGRSEAVVWSQTPVRKLSVPVLIDYYKIRYNIEGVLWALEAMARPPKGSPRGTAPPVVEIAGMVPGTDRRWVINNIDWGEAIWSGMVRVRQYATIELWEHEDLDMVALRAPKPKTRTYTVKKGDTLGSIARKQMGAKTKSQVNKAVAAIKKANSKVRSSKSLKVKMKLKLPR